MPNPKPGGPDDWLCIWSLDKSEFITLPRYSEVLILQGTWKTLHPQQILHAPDVINVHDESVMSHEPKVLLTGLPES